MSIYSGFATRQQEQDYDSLIYNLIFVLQKRLIKFYQQEAADDDKFSKIVLNMHSQLAKMYECKYLFPKCSVAITKLVTVLDKSKRDEFLQKLSNSSPLCKFDASKYRGKIDSGEHINRLSLAGKIRHQTPPRLQYGNKVILLNPERKKDEYFSSTFSQCQYYLPSHDNFTASIRKQKCTYEPTKEYLYKKRMMQTMLRYSFHKGTFRRSAKRKLPFS